MARRFQCPERYLSLAGFEVTFIGRFWLTAEDIQKQDINEQCWLGKFRSDLIIGATQECLNSLSFARWIFCSFHFLVPFSRL